MVCASSNVHSRSCTFGQDNLRNKLTLWILRRSPVASLSVVTTAQRENLATSREHERVAVSALSSNNVVFAYFVDNSVVVGTCQCGEWQGLVRKRDSNLSLNLTQTTNDICSKRLHTVLKTALRVLILSRAVQLPAFSTGNERIVEPSTDVKALATR